MSTSAVIPIEIKLGDGSVIKGEGATREEALQNALNSAAQRVEHNVGSYKTEKQRADAAEQEAQRLRQEAAALRTPPKKVEPGQFDNERYYALLNSDPVAANDYYFEYRFGQSPQDFSNGYQQVANKVSSFEQQAVVAQFFQGHADEFPQTPQAAHALTQKTTELLNAGYPYNARTVEMAWNDAVSEGLITPVKKAEATEDTSLNPTLTGAGATAAADSEMRRIENMNDKELEAYLRSSGQLR